MSKHTVIDYLLHKLHAAGFIENIKDPLLIQRVNEAKQMELEQRFKDFQEGFKSATDSLIGANRLVQSKTYGKDASHE